MDPVWRLQWVRKRSVVVFVIVGCILCAQMLREAMKNGGHGFFELSAGSPGLWRLASIVQLMLGAGLLNWFPEKYPRMFEVVEISTAILAATCIGLMYSSEGGDASSMDRKKVLTLFTLPFVMSQLCMRAKVVAVYVVMHFAIQWAIILGTPGYAMLKTTGFEVIQEVGFTIVVCVTLTSQGLLLRRLYLCQVQLDGEKQASLSLVNLLCDSWCIIAADGNTVVQTDGRFEAMVGRPVLGHGISSFVDGPDEIVKLREMFEPRAATAPKEVVAPVTFMGFGGGRVPATVYVVQQPVVGPSSPGGGPTFLVGVCQALEEERQDALTPAVAAVDAAKLRRLRRQAEAEDRSGSMPSLDRSETATEELFTGSMQQVLPQIASLGEREHWAIRADELRLTAGGLVGRGGFGSVVAGHYYGASIVVKLMSGDDPQKAPRAMAVLSHELRILRHCRHPNLVSLKGAVVDERSGQLGLVLERVAGGDVLQWLGRAPAEGARYLVLVGACRGLWYLHAHRPVIVHGDLKGENVLVASDGSAKLVDFGLSVLQGRNSDRHSGTLQWLAPEVFQRQVPQHPAADCFSLGHFMRLVCTGSRPFEGQHTAAVRRALAAGAVDCGAWPAPATSLQRQLRPLAQACLVCPWTARPTVAQLHRELGRLAAGAPDADASLATAIRAVRAEEEGGLSWSDFFFAPAGPRSPGVAAGGTSTNEVDCGIIPVDEAMATACTSDFRWLEKL